MLLKTVGLYVNLLLIMFLTDCIGKHAELLKFIESFYICFFINKEYMKNDTTLFYKTVHLTFVYFSTDGKV